MAITAAKIATNNTLEQFRQEFNNLQTDVDGLESGTLTFSAISSTTTNSTTLNVLEDGSIIFEGATDDAHETTLTVTDPTADRTITFPNESGNVHTSGGDTTHTNIIIADAGNIGSASDTNAIGISSGGVVSVTATTANTSATDGALTVAGGLGVAADASIGDDLRLISDSAVLSFGADSDTTLTHTDGSGLTLNSTNKLMFNDASQFIQGASATVLDIAATDEIELTATLIDVVGNLAGSGTGTFAGILKTDDTTEATSTTDGSLQTDGGLSVAKDIVAGDDIKLLSDSAVIHFGADSDITLTHAADTSLTTNGVMIATTFEPSADTAAGDNAAIGYTSAEGLILTGQGSTNDVTIKNDADAIVMQIATGGTATEFIGNVTVGGDLDVTGSFDMSDADITNIGSISLDSITGDADANTSITFSGSDVITIATGGSTAATFNASQALTLSGNMIIPDAGTIGSASDTNAISISSGGVVNISATTANTSASDGALTVGGGLGVAADASIGDDLRLISDAAVLSFGTNSEVTLTHVHNSGITLTNTVNGTDDSPIVFQLKSEEDAIVADDVIASIEMAAGDSDGTDGATVAAGIHAIAEGTFSASANATKLVFTTGVSETAASSATAKMTLSSAGLLTIADDFMIKDGGTIGVASTNDAITISSAGIVTFKDDILIKDGGTIGVASTVDAMTISSAGIVTFKDDIVIKDGGTFGTGTTPAAMTIASGGAVTFSATPVFPDGSIALADLDIDGGTDIGAALSTTDLIIVDDGAGGTNRKAALSRLTTLTDGSATALAIALG
jgi:hypothetical protein